MEDKVGFSINAVIEQRRIQALKRYNILNTRPEESFDNIAKLAAQFFDLPIAIISFVDTENVFLKSNIGVEELRNVPRNNSVCSLAVLSDEVTVFEDIPNIDPAVLTDPLLVGEMGFEFYAGAPVITHDGFRIGTICVIGKHKRAFSEKEAKMLQSLAKIVMDQIEMRVRGVFETETRVLQASHQLRINTTNQSIISNMPVAVCVLQGKELVIELANVKMLEIWRTSADVIGEILSDVHHELDGQPLSSLIQDVFATGNPFFGNELGVFFNRNGVTEELFFNFLIQPIKDIVGVTTGIMVIALDITAQINAKKELELNERQLEIIFKNSATGLAVFVGRELIVETANQYVFDLWGRTKEEVIGHSLIDILSNPTDEHFPGRLTHIFETKEPNSYAELSVSYCTPKGIKDYYLDIKNIPLFDDHHNVISIMSTIKDITESVNIRKRLEEIEIEQHNSNEILIKTIQDLAAANRDMVSTHEELAQTHLDLKNTLDGLTDDQPELRTAILSVKQNLLQAEETLRSAIDSANMGTFYVDVDTLLCSVSVGLKKIFGYLAEEEVTYKSIVGQIVEEYRSITITAIEATLESGEPYHMDYPIVGYRDHQIHWLRSFGKLEYNSEGKPTRFAGVTFEISPEI